MFSNGHYIEQVIPSKTQKIKSNSGNIYVKISKGKLDAEQNNYIDTIHKIDAY